MSHNSFGHLFRITTWGESHGPAIGCVVDGCPPGIQLEVADIQTYLDKRRPGQSRYTTQRKEPDQVRILSGVFTDEASGEQVTTGTPIALEIENMDARSKDYGDIKDKFRPGHADYTYLVKYGLRDWRGSGRASARETASRVAAGAIARKVVPGMRVRGALVQVGPHAIDRRTWDWSEVERNPFFSPDAKAVKKWGDFLDKVRKEGSSVGAIIEIVAEGVPAGLGAPVYGKLDQDIASGLMSINAVKGVEFGDGFKVVRQRGSEHRDELTPDGFKKNSSGGTLGGISSGQDILASIALKPTSSIQVPGTTVDKQGRATEIVTTGRHDPCVGLRATPIAEAMIALTLMDHFLRHRAQNADVRSAVPVLGVKQGS
jgi:chorismate synthase